MTNPFATTDNECREPHLERHFGLLSAVSLNLTMIVGSGVFLTIPLMLERIPGPYAILGWVAGALLMLCDGLVWSELGAALPSSGGSYHFLLDSFGPKRWGRLMAFLFIWQFMISGPLEIATGFISMAQVSNSLDPQVKNLNKEWTKRWVVGEWQQKELAVSFGPAQFASVFLGFFILLLLYRRIASLGKWTVTFWIGVLGAIFWIIIEGGIRFNPAVAFDFPSQDEAPPDWGRGLGAAMLLAMYSYLGYYHICYIGDEVTNPARILPRAVLLSALVVFLLFAGLHLAMLGTISWREVNPSMENLPAEFMRRIHPDWAARFITICLIWSSFGSCFAALLGYSRIPFGAAQCGHFFAVLGRIHPVKHIPHVSLFLVGGLTFFWSFFDLGDVIDALVTTRIISQFIFQIIGLLLLRKKKVRNFPFKMFLYPIPCFLALLGWSFLYLTSRGPFIVFSLAILASGGIVFLIWTKWTNSWPFLDKPAPPAGDNPSKKTDSAPQMYQENAAPDPSVSLLPYGKKTV